MAAQDENTSEPSAAFEGAPSPSTTPASATPPAQRFVGVRGAVRFGDHPLERGDVVSCENRPATSVAECALRSDFIPADFPWPAPAGHEVTVRFDRGEKVVEQKSLATEE